MLSLESSETPQVVFTATYPGLYLLTLAPHSSTQVLALNGDPISAASVVVGSSSYPQATRAVYLETGDQLSYTGPAASLYGARQQDGLPDV